nr:hypothetical protein [bacterium]
MKIEFEYLSMEELTIADLELLYENYGGDRVFICDGDEKKIILKWEEE